LFVSKQSNVFCEAEVADGRRQERAWLMLELEQRPQMRARTTWLSRINRATRSSFGTTTAADLASES
jgi:hypothetical protein